MYLKTLVLQGFKSFPDKTVIPFGKAISAIVGPNGSGKSNLSDAIRWVMGEQSTKALRGGKMEDVIFSGTQKRGAVGFAEVTLILDNEDRALPMDESEIMVTRRFYRSGESEYYLNRASVRLKDVHELFMDTGLGREGYSVIGQGKVDEILSVKSGERREIFEEAAGISRFRHRKEEAEQSLKHTRDNLLRIGDKIAELELQVEPLKKQAAVAKKYLNLRDELKGLEVSVWVEDLERLQTADRKTERDLELAASQRSRLSAQLDEFYAEGEDLDARMKELDIKAEEARHFKAGLESQQAELENQIAVLKANAENHRENEAHVRQELLEQKVRAESLSAQTEGKNARLLEIRDEMTGLRQTLDKLIKQSAASMQSAGSIGLEIEALRQEEARKTAEAADEKARLSALSASAQELSDRETGLAVLSGELSDELNNADQRQSELTETLKKTREETGSLSNTIDGYALRLSARGKKASEEEERYRKLEREENALHARLSMLSEMEKMYEGYSKAVRVVMEEAGRGNLQGIRGPVANLMKTSDEYTVAMETALGGALQNIVVEREENGKNAILFLKRRDAGRATFLPLTSVRGRALKEPGIERQPGFVGIAADLVSCDDAYKEIFSNLLGRTVITEDLDAAVKMGKTHGFRFRVVTLDGQVVNPGGSLTGGSISRSAGILSRAGEITRLSAETGKLREDLASAQRTLESAKREAEAAKYDLDVAGDQKRQVERELLKLEADENHLRELLSGLKERKAACRAEQDGIKARILKTDAEMNQARLAIAKLEAESAALREKMTEKLMGQTNLQTAANGLTDDVAAQKARIASLEAEEAATKRSLAELTSLSEDFSAEHAQLSGRMEEYKKKQEIVSAEMMEREKKLGDTAAQINACGITIEMLTGARLDLEGERSRRNRESQELNKTLLAMERECAVLEQRKASFQAEEKGILDRLWDTYALSHSAAVAMKEKLPGLIKAKNRIGELKREISALGSPNVGAIEEYERVSTRYDYLVGQRSDIEKAESELSRIISEIVEKMKSIFKTRFETLSKMFEQTFVELFGGGAARLELEYEADILNCGIEIRVQPPGKALKTITLLSGGEKAFVAIALYFSILKLRPTPFCIMDEIEAALDEPNVARFAKYMRSMTEKTQFVVITHRRGTMEEADVLYGVTMQEQGVSRVLTLNLNELAEELCIQ